ncbi:glycogen debranching protein GlgX [Methylocystis parvus]|uniref:4-alpha-glucanotransferase n=1 Tax=Methylocystis parvus TaxID=134 RepID=A0A6B8M0C4_9HYPH|nr:glycogen debranching protein GlgX [Methylocystis parvus]QGM97194.1 glycogen debranching protein GlgX [Methylocystis parvus]WBJ98901.1 glycogen debranching protein GlgX [Methylocystis parvus OBBP]
MRISDGAPEPLGVTLDETGANIAVFSAHAEEIHLCLFDGDGVETRRLRLPARSGDVFHGRVEGLKEGQLYGLRAYGPNAPHDGQRFNDAKLLIDPYALALDRPLSLHASMFAYGETATQDSAPHLAKCVMTRPRPAATARPRHAWGETVIYEMHVKGFTATHPDVPRNLRGTFAGLAHEASIAHLKNLGVTTLELLPCAAWIDERHLPPLGLSNYWGYNPIAMMAPDPRLAPGGWSELREAVATLHAAGLEIIIDVVFNHTGESDELGPTLSMRGLDNATYYRLRDDRARYVNDAGCGNILAFDRAPVVRLAMDALRIWAIYGGVDGFRFDLATTLARSPSRYDANAPFLAALTQDPVLRELKLIAEPWDIGPGGYQLGRFPAPFAEWNDRYRDCARRFWRGDHAGVSELATRVAGSQDFFARRRPSRSVNFVVAHDGFTLRDLVSYARKHNDANGEENRDGTNDNLSWSNGAEGACDDPAIDAARMRDQRNLLATLLLSRGTPMLAMGAELGATQKGNNNAYAQDNESSWLDWSKADRVLIGTTATLLALRKAHPSLRDDRFLDGAAHDDALIPDVQWLTASGAPMCEEDWRRADADALVAALYAEGDRSLIVFHRGASPLDVTPPPARDGYSWRRAFDSAEPGESEDVAVAPRSVLLLVEEKQASARSSTPTDDALLAQLSKAAGIETRWSDVDGRMHDVPRDTLLRLLASLGLPAQLRGDARDSLSRLAEIRDRRALPQYAIARENEAGHLRLAATRGDAPTRLFLTHEGGREEAISLSALAPLRWRGVDGRENDGYRARLPPLPAGRYALRGERDDTISRLIVAPAQCHLPDDGRRFGFSAQLYSLKRAGDQGMGDFSTLALLARKSGEAGAALLAINPLHALFPNDRSRASPYYPSDRRFLDALYIDLADLFGNDFDAATARALSALDAVDYPATHGLKQQALETAFGRFDALAQQRPDAAPVVDFAQFAAEGGEALTRFALFEAIGETRVAKNWREWPQPLRDADPHALATFADEHAPRLRFHRFVQWVADRQFAQAARAARESGLALGICRDLAVGAAPDGAESWSKAARLIDGFSIGAPPDPFSRDGQSWGLPALDPLSIENDGGADFADLVRANMRHAGALRIDHVMGLARLFLAPEGEKARAGAYLSYPLDAQLAQLALESARAKCMVVGEDLGTLPWGFRERLEASNVLSYRVVWFERAGAGFIPPRDYPEKAMACVSTHDLPTLEGWWRGADIDEKESLALLAPEAANAERAARRSDKRALLDALRSEGLVEDVTEERPFDDALATALHRFAARAPSILAMAQLDDLAGESVAVNLPGTDRERPNWRRKLRHSTERLFETPRAAAIIEGLRRILV